MNTHNLSVVNVTPIKYFGLINALAEAYGCGPNNISVPLYTDDELTHYGCHSFWKPEDYDQFTNKELRELVIQSLEEDMQQSVRDAIPHLQERVFYEGFPLDNWATTLKELGLHQKSIEE